MKIDLKLRKKCLALSFLLLIVLFSGQASASEISGKVVGISDGDTITVLQNKQQYKIRLYGVDCPESSQEFGQKAKEFTSSMVFGKNVAVNVLDVDKYGRSVGVVRINGKTVNESLLKSGYAWLYTKYCRQSFCSEWKVLEEQASERRIGLWADKHPMPPWDWRKAKRGGGQGNIATAGRQAGPSGGSFYGNAKSHVFHAPGCQHYNCKNCTVTFKSVEEAITAGYHKHDQCVKE